MTHGLAASTSDDDYRAMDSRDKKHRKRERSWIWLFGALGLLLLLLGIGSLIAAAIAASRLPAPTDQTCCAIFDAGEAAAQSVGFGVINNLAVFLDDTTDTTLNALIYAFNQNGTWSTTFGNAVGWANISILLENYYFSDYEFFVTNTIHNSAWDYTTSTLTVEYLHEAFTGSDRLMYEDNFTVISYTTETPFAQDRVTVFRFDCSYRIVYLRTYFDNLQRVSTFTSDYPPVCARCSGTCITEMQIAEASLAVHGNARQQGGRNRLARLKPAGVDYSVPPQRPTADQRRPRPSGLAPENFLAL